MLSQRKVPLFGPKYNLKPATEGVAEVECLGVDGFEHNMAWFWFLFDLTISRLLGDQVEKKTLGLVRDRLLRTETMQPVDSSDKAIRLLLPKARRPFGPGRIEELFRIKTNYFNVDSPLMQHFCRWVANPEALDDVYNAIGCFNFDGEVIWPESAQPDFWSNIHLNVPNAQGVRNRYRLVARIYKQLKGGKTLSIACGSAQPLIHAVSELASNGSGGNLDLLLTDISDGSLAIAERKAIQAGVRDKFDFQKMDFQSMVSGIGAQTFDVIEACGILDYLPDDHCVMLISNALQGLAPGGHLILSNMAETKAADFLRRMYNWDIIYRSPKDFARIIQKAGARNVKVFVEPWGIHPVAVATK